MKKLLTWLTKGAKIRKILLQIYRALVTIKSVVSLVLEQFKPEDKVLKKLADAIEYVDIAINGLVVVLEWLGVTETERSEIEKEQLTVETAKAEMEKSKGA